MQLPAGNTPEPEKEILTLAEIEKAYILSVLDGQDWNLTEAAKRLGIGRATIYRKIKSYKIQIAQRRMG